MIFPNEYRLFKVIKNERTDAKIYLYYKSSCIFKGEITDISSERFNKLNNFFKELVEINTSKLPIKIGIEEVQNQIEEFK